MSQTIEVESIRRLDIKPGETLVVGLPKGSTPEMAERARAAVKECIPPGVAILVLTNDVDLSVIPCRSAPA